MKYKIHKYGGFIMRFKIFILIILMLSVSLSYAQDNTVLEKKDDMFEEMDNQNLTLRFFNAVNGNAIPGAMVEIEGIGAAETDSEGKLLFPIPEDGNYNVSFRKKGYIDSDFTIRIMVGTIFFNRFSVSPKIDLRYVRVVLDWDKRPSDLDAHLVKEGGYHISYRNMHSVSDGSAKLDRDDTDGFGPETITIKKVERNSDYRFFIHDYTNQSTHSSRKLSKSKACIKVYGEGKLLQVFNVPQNERGIVWEVFRLENNRIVEVNRITQRMI